MRNVNNLKGYTFALQSLHVIHIYFSSYVSLCSLEIDFGDFQKLVFKQLLFIITLLNEKNNV